MRNPQQLFLILDYKSICCQPISGRDIDMQKAKYFRIWLFLRRDRDSNPGYPCEVRLFSKQVLSATQASLRLAVKRRQI